MRSARTKVNSRSITASSCAGDHTTTTTCRALFVTIPVLVTLLAPVPAAAHPGIGIVMDAKGNVYYTDLKQVWKLTPNGSKSVAVPHVHTHELAIDADGNLYGEHLWYEGEATDKWGHRVWRLSPDGKLVDIIPAREGFLQNYSFVRDGAGHMYWADRQNRVIKKRLVDGRIVVISKPREYRDIRWMTVTQNGTVYLVDYWDLTRVNRDGSVTVIARDLAELSTSRLQRLAQRLAPNLWGDRHAIMGLWTDAAENVYVAVNSARMVKKVTPAGQVSIVARSSLPWSPTGGLIAPNGDLWVLEYAGSFSARARRVGRPM
jgi:streptogramin lyase